MAGAKKRKVGKVDLKPGSISCIADVLTEKNQILDDVDLTFIESQSSANSRQVGGKHYKTKIEHWDFVLANNIPYLEAVAIKYIFRHKGKGGRQDLEKAKHYIEKMIEHYYPPPLRGNPSGR
jgi:hypothetical protein